MVVIKIYVDSSHWCGQHLSNIVVLMSCDIR